MIYYGEVKVTLTRSINFCTTASKNEILCPNLIKKQKVRGELCLEQIRFVSWLFRTDVAMRVSAFPVNIYIASEMGVT